MNDANLRRNITVGSKVRIVEKQNQKTNELTDGIVKRILTNSSEHPHGIKVVLNNGKIGRVREIIGSNPETKY
ncbi:MAG: YwbE family protein [Thaumarchaeota archaeon]|nr:YwbE family protein [Nitrososphaerota archaeon]